MREDKNVWGMIHRMADIGPHRLIADTQECVIIRMENETGEGDMILYRVFEGVYLMYNDFHMEYCESEFQAAESLLAIDYCREGSIQMECVSGVYCVKKPGNVCVDSRVHHKGLMRFPTNHYHGITIGFERALAEKSLREQVSGIPVELKALRNKFCGNDLPFLIREDENLRRLFTDLYQVPEKVRQGYFRAKVLELLVYLSAVEIEDMETEKTYFYRDQIEKVNAIQKLITENLNENYTIEALAERFDISQTALKKCFRNVYGKPIHAYLKQYRMERAAELLKREREMNIGDIAFLVGYESGGKFAAAFKASMGMTPMEYRRQPY
ncbi:MAG: helix-turn-helix transcriptional regulator [Lachnospiraceae bacterium]|nr:helix-turn-helix transcriptional regulator [Lachnospiraceae bacterium]